ncbi:hypothetical protein [Streptomyces formicae]
METVTARQCAARWGISESRARRLLAPLTPVERDTETGAMLYDQEQADAAHADRPGRGTRTDRSTTVMPADDVERLITDETIPVAHRTLWALLCDLDREGRPLRINEALALQVSDVDLDERTVHIEDPKLDSDLKAAPIGERTAELLREAMGDRETGPLIAGPRGRALGRETASRVARQVGAPSIHAFRPPHKIGVPPPTAIPVRADELQVGDVIYWNGAEIEVTTKDTVTAPSGAIGIQINKGSSFPIYSADHEPFWITPRK